jgi:hypothetical protein
VKEECVCVDCGRPFLGIEGAIYCRVCRKKDRAPALVPQRFRFDELLAIVRSTPMTMIQAATIAETAMMKMPVFNVGKGRRLKCDHAPEHIRMAASRRNGRLYLWRRCRLCEKASRMRGNLERCECGHVKGRHAPHGDCLYRAKNGDYACSCNTYAPRRVT